MVLFEKGKSVERQRRKATGLKREYAKAAGLPTVNQPAAFFLSGFYSGRFTGPFFLALFWVKPSVDVSFFYESRKKEWER